MRNNWGLLVLWAILSGILVARVLYGVARAPDPRFDAGRHDATLLLRVVDVAGDPAAGAFVEVTSTDCRGSQRALADEHGRVRIDVEPGHPLALALGGGMWAQAELSVAPLLRGEERDLDEIVLRSGLALSGVVLDSNGVPIHGAEVCAFRWSSQETLLLTPPGCPPAVARRLARAWSGPDGRFSIEGLSREKHGLLVRASGMEQALIDLVQPSAGGGDELIVLEPALATKVFDGRVHAAGESFPPPATHVLALASPSAPSEADASSALAWTGLLAEDDGSFELHGVPREPALGETLWLCAGAPGYRTSVLALDDAGAPIALLPLHPGGPAGGGTVLLRVVGTQGEALPGMAVRLTQVGALEGEVAETDNFGYAVWSGLLYGRYRAELASASAPIDRGIDAPPASFELIDVRAGEPACATLELWWEPVVHLCVVDPTDQSPVPAARVALAPNRAGELCRAMLSLGSDLVTDARGNAVLAAPHEGTFVLLASSGVDEPVAAQECELARGSQKVTLALGSGSVSGQVLAQSSPVVDAVVRLCPRGIAGVKHLRSKASAEGRSIDLGLGEIVKPVDKSGAFRIDRVPANHYELTVEAPGFRRFKARARVGAGEAWDLERIELTRVCTVRGKLAGGALPEVVALVPEHGKPTPTALSAGGGFRFDGVAPGMHRIRAGTFTYGPFEVSEQVHDVGLLEVP